LDLALAVKHKYSNAYTFLFGANIPVKTIGKTESKGLLPFDCGVQVDINV